MAFSHFLTCKVGSGGKHGPTVDGETRVSEGLGLRRCARGRPARLSRGRPRSSTASAYDRYIEAAEQTFVKLISTDAFLTGGSAQALGRLRQGEILLEPGGGDGIISVPQGLIHHWRATAFVPDTTLEQVLSLVRDYVKYPSVYDWVIASDLVSSEEDRSRLRAFFRARRRTSGVTGVFDVWMVTEYRRVRPERATSIAASECVREVEHAGERGERRLQAGNGSGYLWRANSLSK